MEAVIGSRTIQEFDFGPLQLTDVVSGGAKEGIDHLVKLYCKRHKIPIIEFLPDYKKYPPKLAPIMRNKDIVKAAQTVYAIWDGESRGTRMVIDFAYRLNKRIFVYRPDGSLMKANTLLNCLF